jgi:hypothetical protein
MVCKQKKVGSFWTWVRESFMVSNWFLKYIKIIFLNYKNKKVKQHTVLSKLARCFSLLKKDRQACLPQTAVAEPVFSRFRPQTAQ